MSYQARGNSADAYRGKRVLMLIENCPYSEDGRVRREAHTLSAAGMHITVICPRGKGERWREKFGPVTAYQYWAPPAAGGLLGYLVEYSYSLSASFLISLLVAVRPGFDVVHAHNPPDLFVLIGAFYKLFGKRFVFDHHDLAPEMYEARFARPGNRLVRRALMFFEQLSCRWADRVITANDSHKRLEIERSGISLDRITVVRNGPEPCHLQRTDPDPALRNDSRILIGYLGEMGPQDGIDYFLRALDHLNRDFGRTDWRGVLVGDGDALDDLVRLAGELGIRDQLHFTGRVNYRDVVPYISAMDICAVPDPTNDYNNRTTVIKLMEYMAQEKPVVAFDLPEHRVTAGGAALYARPNDPRHFAAQIVRLMDDPSLRRSLGASGRERVITQLAWEHQERHLLAAYEAVLGVGRAPGIGLQRSPQTERLAPASQPLGRAKKNLTRPQDAPATCNT